MPSDALKALARAHAARIVSGEVSPSDGARAIWTDVFYHLEPGDHFADGFVFWGYEIEAVLNLARRLVHEENGATAEPSQRGRVTLDDLAVLQWLEPWRAVARSEAPPRLRSIRNQ